jgi:hypothetical protein
MRTTSEYVLPDPDCSLRKACRSKPPASSEHPTPRGETELPDAQPGVHENTVRRWEENGLLHAVRLPSGVRRLTPREIGAGHSRMYEGQPPMEEETDDVVAVEATSIDL